MILFKHRASSQRRWQFYRLVCRRTRIPEDEIFVAHSINDVNSQKRQLGAVLKNIISVLFINCQTEALFFPWHFVDLRLWSLACDHSMESASFVDHGSCAMLFFMCHNSDVNANAWTGSDMRGRRIRDHAALTTRWFLHCFCITASCGKLSTLHHWTCRNLAVWSAISLIYR